LEDTHHMAQSNKERIAFLIENLQLQPHPEGGYFKETHRSIDLIETQQGSRNLITLIYFLVEENNVSKLHRIKSDEHWFFHEGNALDIHVINAQGTHSVQSLGNHLESGELPQFTVPANAIFGSCMKNGEGYALVSCVVAPGFDFQDFELFDRENLLNMYPQHVQIIKKLT
jgi:uncharacterized protein